MAYRPSEWRFPQSTAEVGLEEGKLAIEWGDVRQALSVDWFVVSFDRKELKSSRAVIGVKDRPVLEFLDQLSAQTGLDYAFFHNAVVIGPPDRLWPPAPPPKPRPLTPDEEGRAREWIEKLGNDAISTREQASSDLLKLGGGVAPLLEKNLDRKESEVVARCKAILEVLKPTPRIPFGPAFAVGQKLGDKDDSVLEMMKKFQYNTVRVDDLSFFTLAEALPIRDMGIPCTIKPSETEGLKVGTIQVGKFNGLDFWSMVTQLAGLDFAIVDGKVIIDTRENLERAYARRP